MRNLIVRFHGFNTADNLSEAACFCSTELPQFLSSPYLAVVDVPNNFSSSITPFEPLGSDPSVTINLLNTPDVRAVLFDSRLIGVEDVLNPGTILRTLQYIPAARPFNLTFPGAQTSMAVDDVVTIGNERLRVTLRNFVGPDTVYTFDTWHESIPNPKPFSSIQQGVAGVPIFRSKPSLEGSFVTISASDTGSVVNNEEPLFKGFVKAWSMDTSASGASTIKVSIGGLIGALQTRSLVPAPMVSDGTVYVSAGGGVSFQVSYETEQYGGGTLVDGEPTGDGQTVPKLLYIIPKDGPFKGVWFLYRVVEASTLTTSSGQRRTYVKLGSNYGGSDYPDMWGTGIQSANVSTSSLVSAYRNGTRGGFPIEQFVRDVLLGSGTTPVSVGFQHVYNNSEGDGQLSYARAIRMVMTGIDLNDDTGTYEEVPATMAAWLPEDCIDLDSILDMYLSNGVNVHQVVRVLGAPFTPARQDFAYLPPITGDGKTLIDYLTEVALGPFAACLVQDGAVIRCFSWAGNQTFPTAIGSAQMAEPAATLTSSRASLLKQVNIVIGSQVASVHAGQIQVTADTTEVVLSDFYGGAVGGKTITLSDVGGNATQYANGYYPYGTLPDYVLFGIATNSTRAFAVKLVKRWGSPVPMLEIALNDIRVVNNVQRDQRLAIGDEVSVTLPQVMGNNGDMGIVNCRGVVIESTRYWMQRQTKYRIALIGYPQGADKPAYWAPCGTITAVDLVNNRLTIEPHDFTTPLTTTPADFKVSGQPYNDQHAFWQVGKLGNDQVTLQLLDSNGLPQTTTTAPVLVAPDPPSNLIEYLGSFSPTVPVVGMIVTLASYPNQTTPDILPSAFIADPATGEVNGNPPWTWQGV